ncbi:conserved hypothetical protein [Anaeromyxobacter sp. K]|uniref:hypothetical protein n=1 Tax=Anaeromyxobacter sp. (strain K) TaxID=447217 RepID=UPI00017BE22F|nr:hypothetical protein [Anaeromyxobacter sp. K]ACG72900.1 conserved hypothetical protein [Anaeromyxobacter sp. K]
MTATAPRAAALAAALAFTAGCSSSSSAELHLDEPSAVAMIQGVFEAEGRHPYLAIASTGDDALVLLDAVDDAPVLSPVAVWPLLVSVAPRPVRLAAGPLGDGGADLLVAISSGGTDLQLVDTWSGAPAVVSGRSVELAVLAPGAVIVDAVAAPVPALAGDTWAAEAGKVRVVAALSGNRVAVVEYARAADGGISAGTTAVQDVGFQPLSLAVNPADPRHVYAATADLLTGDAGAAVQGVAELDASLEPGTWTLRGLDARAPTRLVAAWTLRERRADSAADGAEAFEAAAVDRVYAVLGPGGCGRDERIGCGLAVLDPAAGGLVADPAGDMPYLAPLPLPATAVAIAISGPPARPPSSSADDALYVDPFMKIVPGSTGARATTAVAAVPCGDGDVYWVDLARWEIPNESSPLRSSSARTGVTAAEATLVDGSAQRLGLWTTTAAGAATLAVTEDAMIEAVQVTPGFTTTEDWTVAWQGVLPGLEARAAETGAAADGAPWVALQRTGAGGGVSPVARVHDPRLGVQLDDVVVVNAAALSGCAAEVEGRVTALLAPDAARPGGALALGPPPCTPEPTGSGAEDCTVRDAYLACAPALASGASGLVATVRAGGLLVTGSVTGYAGRAALDETGAGTAFALEYKAGSDPAAADEDALDAACPLVPWPWPDPLPAGAAAVACDAACRATCERLVLARKARRIHHLSETCTSGSDASDTADCLEAFPADRYPFPRANGPVIAFRAGVRRATSRPAEATQRGLALTLTTRSGLSPASRGDPSPSSSDSVSATAPMGAATFDRSGWSGHEADGYRFYVPYLDGHLIDFSPSEGSSETEELW